MGFDLYDVWKRLKEKIYKYRVLLICLAEIIFIAGYAWVTLTRDTVDISFAGVTEDLCTEGISLDRGIYDISFPIWMSLTA